MLCRFGSSSLDYLEQGSSCLLFLEASTLGSYLSLLGAVYRLRRRTHKPIRAYIDTADPAERRLGRILALLGASSWDSPDDHRCFEFYLPTREDGKT